MAESAAVQPLQSPEQRRSLKPCQAIIAGRVAHVRVLADKQGEVNGFVTIMNTPAPDAYSHPGSHEILSRRRLGKVGEDVSVHVTLSGFKRSFTMKNGETVQTVDNKLRAVEE